MATLTNRDIRSAQRTNPHMGHTHIKCLQLNLQHSRSATYNLTQTIIENNIDMAFLQEPYTVRNNVAGFPKSFKIFAYGNGKKRAAIILNNNKIDAVAVQQVSDEDATLIEFSYKGLNFYGASLYFAIDQDLGRDIGKVEEIRKLTRGKGLILSIDSNSRSKLWHDTHTNQRGKTLEEFIITSDLFLINQESDIPTFETLRGRSWIDLTICNNILVQKTRRWTCGENESCSDHNLIRFDIEAGTTGCNASDHTRKRYYIKAQDWEKFENKLASNLLTGFGSENIYGDLAKCDEELGEIVKRSTNAQELMSKFTSIITATCDAAFKVSRARVRGTKGKSVPWWTSELTILRKRALALRRRYQRTRHDDNLRQERKLLYQAGKRHYQAKLQEEKFKSWKGFCSCTADSNPWNVVYKLASGKMQGSTTLSTLQTQNGTYTSDIISTMEHMMEYFIPEDSVNSDSAHHKRIRHGIEEPLDTPDDEEFTMEEILAVIEKFDPGKAPGEDGLNSEILKKIFKQFPTFLTGLYNVCLRKGYFPKQWKHSIIIPIVKPGKEGSTEVTKYRPISLLNIGGKVLEKLLIDRINHHVFSNSLLNGNQYGFLPQKSTIDAALAVKGFIRENLQQKNCVVMVGLDVKGAFDAAWWPSILNNLRDLRCPKNLYDLARNYFSDREASLHANTHTVKRNVTKGCPQGSCCGPGFWNIMYNALLNLNYSSHTKVIAFADDLAVLTKGKTPSESEAFANSDLAKIENWAKENKMQFNETKSKAMLISRKRNTEGINIYINNRKLEMVKEMKYLGIYFDNRFTFNKHITNLAENSAKLIHMLGRSAKLQWGLGNKALKTIYEGALIPLLTYGAPVWEEAAAKQKNIRMLQRVQRMINIKIAKACRTISFEASCVIAGVLPIGLVIEEKANRYKTKHNPACDLPLPVKEWLHPTRRRSGRLTLLADREKELKNWPNTADVVTTTEDKGYEQRTILIYTDGSKNEHGVGSGVAIFVQQKMALQLQFRLGTSCSNNQAEQLAIVKALEAIETIDIPESSPRTIHIFTDSRITIDLLKNTNDHSYLIEEIRKRLSTLDRADWTIGISWVKAHVGIYGNELADRLAKAATRNSDIAVSYNRIPTRTLYRELKEAVTKKWQMDWDNCTKAAITKEFFPNVRDRLKMNICINPNFTAMVTGHGRTRAYLHRFRLIDNATCPCDKEDQTVDHLINQCTLLHTNREILRRTVQQSGNWPASKQELITKHLRSFLIFTKSINFDEL